MGKAAWSKIFFWAHVGEKAISKLNTLYFSPTSFVFTTKIYPLSGLIWTITSYPYLI